MIEMTGVISMASAIGATIIIEPAKSGFLPTAMITHPEFPGVKFGYICKPEEVENVLIAALQLVQKKLKKVIYA